MKKRTDVKMQMANLRKIKAKKEGEKMNEEMRKKIERIERRLEQIEARISDWESGQIYSSPVGDDE